MASSQEQSQSHVDGLHAAIDGVRALLEHAAFVDDDTLGLLSVQQQYSTTVLAQERRIVKLTAALTAARAAEEVGRPVIR